MAKSIYDFSTKTLDGAPLNLADFQGKVLLIVNTASKCGFTPQYEGLQALHNELGQEGLVIIGFPCNQFGKQEPGEESEIGAFCQKNYGVSFLMSEKVDVNGDQAHPLFKYLTSEARGILGTEAIKWNFTKFLIGKNGEVVKRYGSIDTPAKIKGDIQKLLAQ